MTTDRPLHRPIIDVLYVEECPNYPDTLALVQRVGTELGIDVELRTTLIGDRAAAEQARFPGSPKVRVDGRDVEPGSEPPAEYTVACRLYRHEHHFAGRPEERGSATPCCMRPGEPERDLSLAADEETVRSGTELRDSRRGRPGTLPRRDPRLLPRGQHGRELGTVAPGYLWPLWGVALGAATYAYYLRRRGQCPYCGRS